ncbi:ead/Ea22-like family protein [Escherichia coli]|nr:DUF551 domain-containing protein [Escherichia coli]EET4634039.1 DUF551 domain-containing protein [Escherichia coli O157:H7]EFZ0693624.1 DUF551 domain-containing protein [Shigella sonnei]EKM3294591.1 ead/Ea22-like family protein [Escherichia coli O103]ELW2394213.1 ead/Ea22-like family protein [Escherichia coli O157]GEE11927.1 putative phage protein [Escherichia coli O145:H28]
MSEINYQELREAAVATPQKLLAFRMKVTPQVVLALLDERERNQQYIKRRDQENEEIALTVGKLRVELEETKSKLNEQREYYEGVISDGGKRIAELEKSEEQLINERDHAESALTDMYFAATGDEPEWSNWFGFSDAVDAVVDRIADLEAKQPSPVVPDNASEPLAYAYKELTPEIMRNHLAVFERYGIAPNDSSTTIQALRIALDGIERSDAMLHGAEPVSQTYKSQHTQFEQVADLYEMQFDDGRTCAFHTDAQNAAQWLQACDGNRVQEYVKLERLQNALSGNSPVTPDGWISCSERMPKKNQNVLISVNFDSDLVEPLICSARYTGSTFRRGEATIKPGNGVEQVTHWMPLPEPPQEVK